MSSGGTMRLYTRTIEEANVGSSSGSHSSFLDSAWPSGALAVHGRHAGGEDVGPAAALFKTQMEFNKMNRMRTNAGYVYVGIKRRAALVYSGRGR
jgi:hypothetical protein